MAISVLLAMIPESACVPLPSEVTLMAAGFAVHQGALSFPAAVAAATLGNLIGSLLAYGLGRSPAADRLSGSLTGRCDRLFDRFGPATVFFCRLLPLARTFVSLPAGIARVPLARFIALTVAGCAIWSAAFIVAGALSGEAWQEAAGVVGRASLGAAGLAAVALLLRRPASALIRSLRRSAA